MIVVHHLNNSRSQRIVWLLEELALPYRIEQHRRDAKTNLAPPALKTVHPLGSSSATAKAASCPNGARRSTCATSSGCTSPRGR